MINRTAARALLVHEGRLLLIQAPDINSGEMVWVTPGGGIDPGETLEEALKREVFEEVGYRLTESIRLVWRQVFYFGKNNKVITQQNNYFYIPLAEKFTPTSAHNPVEEERLRHERFEWLSLTDMEERPDCALLRDRYPHFLDLLKQGPPAKVLDFPPEE